MEGNPFVEKTSQLLEGAADHDTEDPEATLLTSTALVYATLAVAHEQRMANLIAFHGTPEPGPDEVLRQIREGMGMQP